MTATPAGPELTPGRIAELTAMAERHPATDSWYYTGPLEEGKRLLRLDFTVAERTMDNGSAAVIVASADVADLDTMDAWGCSAAGDFAEAWRYAIGTECVPADTDDLFDPSP